MMFTYNHCSLPFPLIWTTRFMRSRLLAQYCMVTNITRKKGRTFDASYTCLLKRQDDEISTTSMTLQTFHSNGGRSMP